MGAGTAFFLDPRVGKRRRRLVVDRSLGFLRRSKRIATGKVKLVGGQARGVLALGRRLRRRTDVKADDRTVEQRIRSDAFRDVGVSTRDVDVEVENGLAKLRGSIDSISLADDLVSRVRKIPGVREVSAELQVAGT
jgi:osmotically-inducible protein OsmY